MIRTRGQTVARIIISIILVCVALTCILPFVYLLASSLSTNEQNVAGNVFLVPVDFTLQAYKYLLKRPEYFTSLWVSVKRVVIGTAFKMIIVTLTAYALSKPKSRFRHRGVFMVFFLIINYFGGGMMSTYMVNKELGLVDNFWVLILPGALDIWNITMLMNYFREVPKEIEEAAIIDGCGQFRMLTKIFIPISKPGLATILLFSIVGHWNSWFDGILYMNSPEKYPLQSYLYTVISGTNLSNTGSLSLEQIEALKQLGNINLQSAQIFLGALPIMLVYPFLQKYFIKGIKVGSVKG